MRGTIMLRPGTILSQPGFTSTLLARIRVRLVRYEDDAVVVAHGGQEYTVSMPVWITPTLLTNRLAG